MAKPKPATEQRPPVDAEDDDRRLAPLADTEPTTTAQMANGYSLRIGDPEPSAQQDEHRGLAARILDLRKLIEDRRQAQVKENAQTLQRMANLEQLISTIQTRVDKECEAIQKAQGELRGMLHDGGEQVRQSGAIARKIQDGMRELEELRAVASDPHEVVKPVQRALAHLRTDHEALAKTIDIRFEQMPRAKTQAWEARGEDEDPALKLEVEVRKLRQRLEALERN